MTSSSLSLLGLPPTIRQRIYFEAGLVVDTEIALHHEERADRRQNGGSIPSLGPSTALMLVCRSIYAEASRLLYSKNTFFIRYQSRSKHVGARDLGPLRRLSPTALSLLTSLDIHLHVAARKAGTHDISRVPRTGMTYECPDSGDEPLSSASAQGQEALLEWQTTARHCSPYIRPGTLHLSLICDVADFEMAHRITDPLNQFPVLASCRLRLGNDPKSGLLHIARDAATRAQRHKTGCLETSSGLQFRFLDLPIELRLHILEYTDLVTPLSRVSWNPRDGYKPTILAGCSGPCGPPYEMCHPRTHRGCKPCQCLQQPKCPHQQYKCWLCGHYACQFRRCWRRDRGCFCSSYHAAYSPQCNCWLPPTPLFLVNRAFCADARATFFSQNHFTIDCARPYSDDPYELGRLPPRQERHPGSIFLMSVVPASSLKHLRSLEFRSLSIDTVPVSDDPADQDWLRTIDHVKDRIDPRLVMLDVYIENSLDRPDTDFYNALAEEGGIDLLKGYLGSFWPLEISGSSALQEFYVSLLLGEEVVGYYIRPRHRGSRPEIEACLAGSEIRSEREWQMSGHQSPESLSNSNKVEGIWGYIYTY
ncbi:hypothetical protein BR93DRAFT_961442 [Coniochaeta sp. PMI_546]|nr:hypothetical protein BR93DRAFT_961442 [Coniochaeta sp. PMI_546]